MNTQSNQSRLLSTVGLSIVFIASAALLSACEPKAQKDVPAATAETKMMVKDMALPVKTQMDLPATTQSEAARKHYMAGWADYENSRFDTANKHFEAAGAADPTFAVANIMSARTAGSTEGFMKNVKLAGDNMAGASEGEQLLIKAVQRVSANDSVGATAAAEKLTEVHPNSPRAWDFLAGAYGNANETAKARATYKKAISLDPTYVPGHINLGNSYLTQEPKNFAEAEKHFKHAIELTPNEPNPYDLLGDVHRAQNNLKAAYDDYTKAAELAPERGSGLQQRGHVNSFLGKYDAARADYAKAGDLEDARGSAFGPGFRVFGAYVDLHEGNPKAAMSGLQAIADKMATSSMEGANDTRVNALLNIAVIAMESGDNKAAKKAIDEAGATLMAQADKLDSDDLRNGAKATVHAFNGQLAAKKGDAKAAAAEAAAFEKAVASNTSPRKLERMHQILGMSAYQQGDYAAAIEHLSKGDHVNNMRTKYYLARAHEEAGHADEAAKMYKEMAVYNFNGPIYAMLRKDIVKRAGG